MLQFFSGFKTIKRESRFRLYENPIAKTKRKSFISYSEK